MLTDRPRNARSRSRRSRDGRRGHEAVRGFGGWSQRRPSGRSRPSRGTRPFGFRPASCGALVTVDTMSACWSWRTERFTLTARSGDAGRDTTVWRQASRTTHRPRSTMSPVSPAIGANSAGGTVPRRGCRDRTSASVATIPSDRTSKIGWYSTNSSPRSRVAAPSRRSPAGRQPSSDWSSARARGPSRGEKCGWSSAARVRYCRAAAVSPWALAIIPAWKKNRPYGVPRRTASSA